MTKDEAPTSPKDAALKLALEALEDLLDQTEPPPDTNCSCHICPPCNDCVDYSGVRYAIEQANKTITAIKEALAQPERPWVSLTREEINSALSKYQNWYEFAAHLENILKEKNQ